MHLAGVKHNHVARAVDVRPATVPGQGSARFGHGNHKFLVSMRREAELHEAGAKQLQPTEDIYAPEPSIILLCGHVPVVRAVFKTSVAPSGKNVQDKA